MQRFSFNLQSILDLRLREEDEAKAFLMSCEEELQKANAEFQNRKEELTNFQNREKESRGNSAANAVVLKHSVTWRNTLKLEILKVGRQIQEISMDVARAKAVLMEATIKRKSLEKLREQKKEEWQKEYDKNEQIFLDDIAQSRQRMLKNS